MSIKFPVKQKIQDALDTPFDNASNDFVANTVQEAIEEAREGGIKTFPVELHFVSGTGGNITMNNSTFFRIKPGTFDSGSFAGYTSCFPLLVPFNCRLKDLVLTFTIANFDWVPASNAGPVSFDLEFRSIIHNGSSVYSIYRVSWGNYSGSQIPFAFNTFSLGSSNLTLISGTEVLNSGDLIGWRFVKSTAPARNINNFQNILLTLNFEED